MISNLFSIFDPSSNIRIRLGWMSLFLFIFIMTPKLWTINNKFFIFIIKIFISLYNEFNAILGKKNKNLVFFSIRLFLIIFYNNFLGLFPYIFNSTSHMSVTLTLALPIWLALNFYGWINLINIIFAHLVPQSTPIVLIPFIVVIETIRNVIRPLTLAIRLTANIIAGHLLITLLGNQLSSSSGSILLITIIPQVMLRTLELAVSIIQAYVFSILVTLYINETARN